ncbi:hypothetical protein RJD39_00115 [Vibrio scophthalmi]|uniref:hypothetical protein n=1 Tax=Vibrio scophthalmi TaxID=45658 RepID=UPI003872EAF1
MMIVKHPEGAFWLRVGNGLSVSFDACVIEGNPEFVTLYKEEYPVASINTAAPDFKLLPNELRKIRVPSPFRARLIKHHKAQQAAAI